VSSFNCLVQPQRNQAQTAQWVVGAEDKVKYDAMFLKADSDRDGFVSGAEIKGIFLKSGLPQPALAHIWYVLGVFISTDS